MNHAGQTDGLKLVRLLMVLIGLTPLIVLWALRRVQTLLAVWRWRPFKIPTLLPNQTWASIVVLANPRNNAATIACAQAGNRG